MIESLSGFPSRVAAFACKGRVTRQDYDSVLIPVVEKLLADHDKVRLYYEIDPGFEGIDAGAVWKDFRVGIEHLSRWERMAVVTDVHWIRHTIQLFRFVIPGEVEVFPVAETERARAWIAAS